MTYALSLLLAAVVSGGGPAPKPARAASVVIVHARDFSFVAPKTVKSGVNTFRLVNDGKELHHLSIIKLEKGKTMADLAAALKKPGPPPTWMKEVGGPNPALPGSTVEATLALDAGSYVMVCFIPSPGSTVPHVMKGMMAAFTVTPDASGAAEAVADATVHLSDYTFTVDKPLAAGHRVLKVVNDAQQPHELVMVQLAPGKTIADVGSWVEKDLMKGPPPGKPIGGMSGLANGRSASFTVDLKPGKYGLICFAPDARDGKSHFAHGMSKEIVVAAK
ncbi:MAG: hypothetical protein M3Z05_04005 [Gemmatimonadota bacterium]|nr:hypothetical protein [Gemmatimonadota bacterium]